MKKEFKTYLIPLDREPQIGDIVKWPGHNVYELIVGAEHLKRKDNCQPHQLVVISDEPIKPSIDYVCDGKYIEKAVAEFYIVSKKVVYVYPTFRDISSLSTDFIKQYIKAKCPEKIYLNGNCIASLFENELKNDFDLHSNEEITFLLSKMQEAKELHEDWSKSQAKKKEDGLPLTDNVGDVEWHNEWADVYTRVIKILSNKS